MIQTHKQKAIAGRIVVQATKPAQTFSTQMQSPSFRRRILDAAKRDNTLHTLYWHIEFRSPVSLLPPWLKAQNPLTGSVVFVASHPGKHIPVIPVGDEPAISMEYAELLRGWMHSRNRWVQDIGIALMPADLLRGLKWYEWGDRLPPGDEFCKRCGAVGECVCDAGRLALVAGGGRLHLSRGGQRALCGRCVQGARWVSTVERWERKRLGELDLCKNCARVGRVAERYSEAVIYGGVGGYIVGPNEVRG